MEYEILYRTYFIKAWHYFPQLVIKYRRVGNDTWSRIQAHDLDEYAEHEGWFYPPYGIHLGRDHLFLELRTKEFLEKLHERCGGSLDSYVKKIVLGDIMRGRKESKIEQANKNMLDSLVTNGWKGISIKIEFEE